jgi:uncharacterized protein DUF4124
MRTALLLLLALAAPLVCSTAAAADVWKWVDEKGITHYSDQPVPGATKIEVRTGNVVATQPAGSFSSGPAPGSPARPAEAPYRNFEIWRPEPNQSINNTGGEVAVEIRIEPEVSSQHVLNLMLDGRLVQGFPRNTLSYVLQDVSRGTHTVTATVNDQRGVIIADSNTVTFNVRQESIAQPPVGPSLRPPPPKPTPRAANKLPSTQPSYGALNGSAHQAIDPATNLPVVKKHAPKPGKP